MHCSASQVLAAAASWRLQKLSTLEGFFALTQPADKNYDGLKAFQQRALPLQAPPVKMEQLQAAVNPAFEEFGMHCWQHAALLAVATLHLLLRLGKPYAGQQ